MEKTIVTARMAGSNASPYISWKCPECSFRNQEDLTFEDGKYTCCNCENETIVIFRRMRRKNY